MKRREDGAVREVMKELLRSDLRFHKTDCGRFSAMTAWGLKDTSSLTENLVKRRGLQGLLLTAAKILCG